MGPCTAPRRSRRNNRCSIVKTARSTRPRRRQTRIPRKTRKVLGQLLQEQRQQLFQRQEMVRPSCHGYCTASIKHRLHNEFPELVSKTRAHAGPAVIAEIGCGAGNSVFPLLASNENPELSLLAYDYSHHAVKLVQNNPLYTSPPMGTIHAEPWDLSSSNLPPSVQPGTVDIVVLVFVLSALHPDEWHQALTNVHAMLKPGGKIMLRDYGRHDLTQLRFKGGRLLDDNFYIRGDKTRVYFFALGMFHIPGFVIPIPQCSHRRVILNIYRIPFARWNTSRYHQDRR